MGLLWNKSVTKKRGLGQGLKNRSKFVGSIAYFVVYVTRAGCRRLYGRNDHEPAITQPHNLRGDEECAAYLHSTVWDPPHTPPAFFTGLNSFLMTAIVSDGRKQTYSLRRPCSERFSISTWGQIPHAIHSHGNPFVVDRSLQKPRYGYGYNGSHLSETNYDRTDQIPLLVM